MNTKCKMSRFYLEGSPTPQNKRGTFVKAKRFDSNPYLDFIYFNVLNALDLVNVKDKVRQQRPDDVFNVLTTHLLTWLNVFILQYA